MITTPEIQWIAILPEVALALGAAAVLLVEVQWKPVARVLGVVAGITLLVATGFTILQWLDAQDAYTSATSGVFGTTLVAFSGMVLMDGLAIYARLVLLAITGLGLAGGWKLIQALGRRGAEAIALILLATAGFSIMVASNNLILMFLGLEVGSIALYVLAGLTTERKGSDEAAMKYFLLGSFASAVLVYGVALLYAGTGNFEILAIRQYFSGIIAPGETLILIAVGLVIVGLGFKTSAAPFHSWAPDVYQGAPAGLVGYMASVAKIAGFVALGRFLVTGVGEFAGNWAPVLAGIAALSMVLGSIVALVQSDVRRMLAYSGVAHAGFIMTGLVGLKLSGMLFYIAIYSVQLVAAFAVVAAVSGPGESASPLSDFRGLSARRPALAAGFTVVLLGLAGLPLTSGFIAKFGVLTEAWENGHTWLVYVAVLASVIALAFYLRIVVSMYMEEEETGPLPVPKTLVWVLGIAVIVTVVLGIFPGFLLDVVANAFAL